MNAHRVVKVNDKGARIGEDHPRAKLTDHDVSLILALLESRERLIKHCEAAGLKRGEIRLRLAKACLSFAGIAAKFDVCKRHVHRIYIGTRRGQAAARWKRVGEPRTA